MEKIRVMLVDDYPMIRAGIRTLFTGEEDIEIVGEAADGQEALELLQNIPVDVALPGDLRDTASQTKTRTKSRQHAPMPGHQ